MASVIRANSTATTISGGGTSHSGTWSVDCTLSDELIVALNIRGEPTSVTAPTFNGVSMTLIEERTQTTDPSQGDGLQNFYIYRLSNPSRGSYNIVTSWVTTQRMVGVAIGLETGGGIDLDNIVYNDHGNLGATSTVCTNTNTIGNAADIMLGIMFTEEYLADLSVTTGTELTEVIDPNAYTSLSVAHKTGVTGSQSLAWQLRYGAVSWSIPVIGAVTPVDIKNDASLGADLSICACTTSDVTEDVHNSHVLTNNASVTTATGKQGTASQLTGGSSQYLSIADHADFSPTSDCSIACWVYRDSAISTYTTLASKDDGDPNRSYAFGFRDSSGDQYHMMQSELGTNVTTNNRAVAAGITFSTATWYHIVLAYDASSGTVACYRDGTLDATMTSTSTFIFDSTAAFEIGRENGGSYWDGRLNQVLLYKKTLNATDATKLSNSGTGIPYEAVADVTVTPTTQVATFTIPSYVVSIDATLTPSVLSATFTIPTYTILAGSISFQASALSATFATPPYTVSIDRSVTVDVLNATFSLPVSATVVQTVTSPTTQVATFTIPSYTLDIVFNVVGAKITPNLRIQKERVIINKM